MARFWVKRTKQGPTPVLPATDVMNPRPRTGWTGSMHGGGLRSRALAEREAQAWRDAGWDAEVVESTPEVLAEIRAWEREKAAAA